MFRPDLRIPLAPRSHAILPPRLSVPCLPALHFGRCFQQPSSYAQRQSSFAVQLGGIDDSRDFIDSR